MMQLNDKWVSQHWEQSHPSNLQLNSAQFALRHSKCTVWSTHTQPDRQHPPIPLRQIGKLPSNFICLLILPSFSLCFFLSLHLSFSLSVSLVLSLLSACIALYFGQHFIILIWKHLSGLVHQVIDPLLWGFYFLQLRSVRVLTIREMHKHPGCFPSVCLLCVCVAFTAVSPSDLWYFVVILHLRHYNSFARHVLECGAFKFCSCSCM